MSISLFAVGDVFIDRPDPEQAYRDGARYLRRGDILFGNCEGVFSDDWDRAPSSGPPVVAPAANADPLARAGFDVLSLANNHIGDGGHRGLRDTIRALNGLGIATVGAGGDIAEARSPAIVERDGIRVGFLAYASVFPYGYEARGSVPGLAPIRSYTHYNPPTDNLWDPGAAPSITTEEVPEDAEALIDDIIATRERADVVVVSVHWGDMYKPFVLRDHERRIARLVIDAGADVVLGHHHHMWRGMEFYRGKPIWYGLGHHLFDLPDIEKRIAADGDAIPPIGPADDAGLDRYSGSYRLGHRAGYPLLPFHPDGRLTGVAIVRAGRAGVGAVGFAPAVINQANEPIAVAPDSDEGRRVLDYLKECCTSQGLRVRFGTPEADSGLPPGCVQLLPPDGTTRSTGEEVDVLA
ncbi:CapA family protein [Micromonospora profundi]|uniref:CapA family protein n=1 Tax=Micromonospora profundi TaxID=1420889 RepID=UPI003661E1BF